MDVVAAGLFFLDIMAIDCERIEEKPTYLSGKYDIPLLGTVNGKYVSERPYNY